MAIPVGNALDMECGCGAPAVVYHGAHVHFGAPDFRPVGRADEARWHSGPRNRFRLIMVFVTSFAMWPPPQLDTVEDLADARTSAE